MLGCTRNGIAGTQRLYLKRIGLPLFQTVFDRLQGRIIGQVIPFVRIRIVVVQFFRSIRVSNIPLTMCPVSIFRYQSDPVRSERFPPESEVSVWIYGPEDLETGSTLNEGIPGLCS